MSDTEDHIYPRPPQDPLHRPLTPEELRAEVQEALHEVKRVIVGQDAMLERLLVALLAGGHVLLEGVPGLAKTLTVKTLAKRPRRRVPPRAVHAGPRPRRSRRHPRLPP